MKVIYLSEFKSMRFALSRFKDYQFKVDKVVICGRVFTTLRGTQRINKYNLFNIKI